MFENSSVFILSKNDEVYRLEVEESLRIEIVQLFLKAKDQLVENKQTIEFDGSYKPSEDECIYLPNYKLSDEILDSIRNPIVVRLFRADDKNFPEIKAVFIGEKIEQDNKEIFRLAFQLFRREQYLIKKGFNLFYRGTTFEKECDYGFNISSNIDCYYDNGTLYFCSFYFARQIFDLRLYYRTATDNEVREFISSPKLSIENEVGFKEQADTWVRRRIAIINDSAVLEKYTAEVIQKMAEQVGLALETKDGKLVIPLNKEKMKAVLGFLDEETYQGPFSNALYLANSKRKMNI